jgi:CheY-like chemotaxis protein
VSDSALEFFVEDTGIGISEDKQVNVFDRFWQADTAVNRQFQGMGLGLSIAKSYVEMLGGKIWVKSVKGKGSKFGFTIPYKPTKFIEEKRNALNETSLSDDKTYKTILVVEDEMYNFMLIKALLSKFKIKLLHAMNGLDGVNMCKEHSDIILVLMDIRLPVMDGFEATKHIKLLRPDLPVVVLTAYALQTDEDRIMKSGCDAYLPKPLSSVKLFETLNKFNKN